MAFMTDKVYNKDTGKYDLHFVNQQYDFLMTIYFDPKTGKYKCTHTAEEAVEVAASWGRSDFKLQPYIDEMNQTIGGTFNDERGPGSRG